MISDITLGQFFPGESPIHKLDPRTKILAAIVFIVAVFLADSPVAYLFLTAVTLLMVLSSRISLGVVIRGIKPILFVLLFTMLISLFMTKGEGDPLFSFFFLAIYKEGIYRAVLMSLRVILMIIGTSILLTYTTSPISLTDGLESLLSPLRVLHIPVHIFAMMMSIALRFIPTLIEETDRIMSAQKSRGADFETGSILQRAKALIPLLIPLIISSFKRADELAVAMECRCYRGDKKRTKLTKLEMHGRDALALLAFAAILAGAILIRTMNPALRAALPAALGDIIFFVVR